MESGFIKANSTNLPRIDAVMLGNFFASNTDFCSSEFRNAKTSVLIILLALVVGVLYCLHLLVQDYQALTAPRLLRFLFKRDVSSQAQPRASVRWRRILQHDPIQCARYVYCDLGARPADNTERQGFSLMLTLKPQEEDRAAWEVFQQAYQFGKSLRSNEVESCHSKYSSCPFHASLLFELMQYMIRNHY